MDSKDKDIQATKEMIKVRHKLVYDITTRLESFSLNTVVSGFMEYNNKLMDDLPRKKAASTKRRWRPCSSPARPFAPHIAEEMWEQLGHKIPYFDAGWPDL